MSEPWKIHTLVFDLDDTLYPERDFVLSGFAAVDAWLVRKHAIRGFGAKTEALFAAGLRGTIFNEALAMIDATRTISVEELVEVYRNHSPVLQLSEESSRTLEWAVRSFRVGIVSDGFLAVQRRKAEALGLWRWTENIIFSDEWGREAWKPSHRPFDELMSRLPGESAGFLYIGDNPQKDFIAPRALGWRTVRYLRTGGEHIGYKASVTEAAECEITDLRELRNFVVRD